MNFLYVDIVFLILFSLIIFLLLYPRRKNLKREGLLFLYRTQWGIRLINYIGGKYKKTLYALSYAAIFVGYILMAVMLYLLGRIVYIYVSFPEVARAIKVPPVMPLIPYLPQVFKLDYLPPFYFTYWIITLAIIAIAHEFAHGILMKRYGIRIKSTGFGFLGPFLAAFVEQDEKQMTKKSKGTFANVLTSIFFIVVLWIFFALAFTQSGVVFDTYAYSIVPISGITAINGIPIGTQNYNSFANEIENKTIYNLTAEDKNYLGIQGFFSNNEDYVKLYDDAPAIKSGIIGAITDINGVKIKNQTVLENELRRYSPGDEIKITTKTSNQTLNYIITLQARPDNKNLSWLGIGFNPYQSTGILGKVYSILSYFQQKNVYYTPRLEIYSFIYDLLWWIILISLSVALVNMLPVGIFDGGRFFYLTVLGITKNENVSKKIFSFMTYLFLFLLFALMIFWAISFV